MLKKQKTIALALAAALSISAFSGCSSNNSAASTSASAGSASAGAKTTIEYWHINNATQGGSTVDEFIKEFNASQNQYQVVGRFNSSYDAIMKNLQADTAAGKAPAIVQVSWSNIEYFPNNFSYISPDDIVKKYFPDDKDFLTNTFDTSILNLAKNSQGILAGVPYSVSNPVLFYNADLLKKSGLSDQGPKTWDEFVSYAKTVHDKTGKYGAYLQEGDTWVLQALLESAGAKMITWNNGKANITFNTDKGRAAFQSYADMVLKDKSTVHLPNLEDGLKAFNDGDIAMIICSIAKATNIQQSAHFDVRSTTFPTFTGEKRAVPAGGCYLAITAADENQQKGAWQFIKFLLKDDNAAKWVAGTGYVPSTKGAENSQILKDYLKKNPLMEAAMEQRADAVQWAAYPGNSSLEAQQILLDTRNQILSGSKSVDEALPDAQKKIQALIQ